MGCFVSKPAEADRDAAQRNARIDRVIKSDKKTMDRTIKILLLGQYHPPGANSRSSMFGCAIMNCTHSFIRCRRVGKIYHHQANAHYSQWRLSRGGALPNTSCYLLEHCRCLQGIVGHYECGKHRIWAREHKGSVLPRCSSNLQYTNSFPKAVGDLLDKTEPDVGSDDAFSDLKVRDAMRTMWRDGGVQKAVARGHEFALHDNLS